MLTIELEHVSIFLTRSPISFDDIFLWCAFLGQRLITCHSNIVVQIIVVLDSCMSTLGVRNMDLWGHTS